MISFKKSSDIQFSLINYFSKDRVNFINLLRCFYLEPTDIYNFYYFKEVCPSNVKIIHYKNDIWLKGQQYKDILL